jgi:hypothetical protein
MVYFEQHVVLTDETYSRVDALLRRLESIIVVHKLEHFTFSPEGLRQIKDVVDRLGGYLVESCMYLAFAASVCFLAILVFSWVLLRICKPGGRRGKEGGRKSVEDKND